MLLGYTLCDFLLMFDCFVAGKVWLGEGTKCWIWRLTQCRIKVVTQKSFCICKHSLIDQINQNLPCSYHAESLYNIISVFQVAVMGFRSLLVTLFLLLRDPGSLGSPLMVRRQAPDIGRGEQSANIRRALKHNQAWNMQCKAVDKVLINTYWFK